jgi:uncharacterized protein YidB (DUF937 family)
MLEQLINLVKENAGEAIVNNPAIPNQHNQSAINETAQGIMKTLQSQLAGGKMDSLTSLLKSNGSANNPLVGTISQQVTTQLTNKLGIDNQAASRVVSSLIPVVMNKFASKTNDPNDSSFTVEGIMSSIGGVKGSSSILDSIKGLFAK